MFRVRTFLCHSVLLLVVLASFDFMAEAQSEHASLLERNDFDSKPTECRNSLSQYSEEDALRKAFGWERKHAGTYVEIGALNGEKISNTLSLATCQHWGGVLVEGSRQNYDALLHKVAEQQRPNVTAYYGAVCTPPHKAVRFLEKRWNSGGVNAVGGDISAMGTSFIKQWHSGYREGETRTVAVPCRPMEHYLQGVSHVDFFSLDVEGAELLVLETIDFNAVTIDVFMIEFDAHQPDKNWKISKLMSNLNYRECRTFQVWQSKVFVRKAAGLEC